MAARSFRLAAALLLPHAALAGRVRHSEEALSAGAGRAGLLPAALAAEVLARASPSEVARSAVRGVAAPGFHPLVDAISAPSASAWKAPPGGQDVAESSLQAAAVALLNRLPIAGPIAAPVLGLEVIGEGASALILSTGSKLGKPMAVKMMTPSSDVEAAKTARDIQMLRLFHDHPGFVDVYAATETRRVRPGRNVYVVMERAAGDLTDQVISKSMQEVPKSTRIRLFIQVLGAVADMSWHGLAHRDLKPRNVLIRGDCARGECSAALCDMETACKAGSRRWPCLEFRGTPGFIPPEVWQRGAAADAPARDVWALGMVLYQLMHGSLPALLPTGSVHEVRSYVSDTFRIEDDPVWQASQAEDGRLAKVIQRMLDRDPRRRISARAALQEMLAYARGAGIDADYWRESWRDKLRRRLGRLLEDLWKRVKPRWYL